MNTVASLTAQYNTKIESLDKEIKDCTATIAKERARDNSEDNFTLQQAREDKKIAEAKRQVYFRVTKDLETV